MAAQSPLYTRIQQSKHRGIADEQQGELRGVFPPANARCKRISAGL
jgi:hypothetical protein